MKKTSVSYIDLCKSRQIDQFNTVILKCLKVTKFKKTNHTFVGVLVTSDIDLLVNAIAFHKVGADAFVVPPLANLGTDHVAVTYIYTSMVSSTDEEW